LGEFSPICRLITTGSFFRITEKAHILSLSTFTTLKVVYWFGQKRVGLHFGRIFQKTCLVTLDWFYNLKSTIFNFDILSFDFSDLDKKWRHRKKLSQCWLFAEKNVSTLLHFCGVKERFRSMCAIKSRPCLIFN
jgi:hypothetical protein